MKAWKLANKKKKMKQLIYKSNSWSKERKSQLINEVSLYLDCLTLDDGNDMSRNVGDYIRRNIQDERRSHYTAFESWNKAKKAKETTNRSNENE